MKEFPKQLNHPAYTAAVISRDSIPGTPVKFPPIWVGTPDEEQWYLSRGYVSKESDPSVWETARNPTPPVDPNYVFVAYPKWVGSPAVIVQNLKEEKALLRKQSKAKKEMA